MSPRRKLLAAIGIGVALAAVPVAALNFWLGSLVERQGQDEINSAARRHMAQVESRVAKASEALEELASRGIDSCSASNIGEMRQATFATAPIKEVSVVGPDGRTLCTDVGNAPDQRNVVSSEPLSPNSRMLLDVVEIGSKAEHWVRIRRPGPAGGNSLAVLMPASLFVPLVSGAGGPFIYRAQAHTAAGSLIAQVGDTHNEIKRDDLVASELMSKRYGVETAVTASASGLATRQVDLRAIGAIASGLLAVAILALALLLPSRERENPIEGIELALKAGEFVPYFQPIVDIRSGRLRGAEVLIRWKKPDGTIMPPATFVPLAESTGLIVEMTRELMRRVCKDAGAVLKARPHLKIGFNLTAQHFANEEIVEDVRSIFKKSPVRLSQVVLEVTERQPIENLTETRRVIAALQGLGVRVAIDDVGTGHSGLSYMLKLGVDTIKIDKMFVDAIGKDRHSNTIIETLIDLAQNMRMDVIAEGVESFEQVIQLRDLGIRAAQGFVFSPPLPPQAFVQLVEAIDPIKGTTEAVTDGPGAAIAAFAETDAVTAAA